ncbi:MAG: hypothetical protein MHM6MM_007371 [Cercozoa sp. M6MM]
MYSGQLYKRDEQTGRWRSYYAVVGINSLLFFRDQQAYARRQPADERADIVPREFCAVCPKRNSKKHRFRLYLGARTLEFHTTSAQKSREWATALDAAVRLRLRAAYPSLAPSIASSEDSLSTLRIRDITCIRENHVMDDAEFVVGPQSGVEQAGSCCSVDLRHDDDARECIDCAAKDAEILRLQQQLQQLQNDVSSLQRENTVLQQANETLKNERNSSCQSPDDRPTSSKSLKPSDRSNRSYPSSMPSNTPPAGKNDTLQTPQKALPSADRSKPKTPLSEEIESLRGAERVTTMLRHAWSRENSPSK